MLHDIKKARLFLLRKFYRTFLNMFDFIATPYIEGVVYIIENTNFPNHTQSL